MSGEPKHIGPAPAPPVADMPDAERKLLIDETLRSLQEAFSAPADEDDAETITELNQNAADVASDTSEVSP
ncbi:MAG: hypothetical protein JSR99_18915 [Proteobacteria bacterium]|nr:hypothetical protein [Pseudomonadota bacterium]